MDKKERFKKAYNYLRSDGLIEKQQDLAEKMQASRPNVSLALKGNTKVLTDNFLTRFCRAYPGTFNLEWLLTGEGEMLQKQEPEAAPMDKQQDALTYAALQIGKLTAELESRLENVKLLEKHLTERLQKIDNVLGKLSECDLTQYPGAETIDHRKIDLGIAADELPDKKKKVAK